MKTEYLLSLVLAFGMSLLTSAQNNDRDDQRTHSVAVPETAPAVLKKGVQVQIVKYAKGK
jgi:hypothetical protein